MSAGIYLEADPAALIRHAQVEERARIQRARLRLGPDRFSLWVRQGYYSNAL